VRRRREEGFAALLIRLANSAHSGSVTRVSELRTADRPRLDARRSRRRARRPLVVPALALDVDPRARSRGAVDRSRGGRARRRPAHAAGGDRVEAPAEPSHAALALAGIGDLEQARACLQLLLDAQERFDLRVA